MAAWKDNAVKVDSWRDRAVPDEPAIEGIDTSPIDLPSATRIFSPSEYEDPMVLEVPAPGAELASKGVDVTTGAPVGSRLEAGFAKNELSAVAHLEKTLDTRIRLGPDSNQPEYLRTNPATGKKRWTLVDESAFVGKDIGEIAKALPMLGSMAGAAIPGAGILTMAVGSGLGEELRLAIGEMLGVNDVSMREYAVEGAKITAFDAVVGWGANKFMDGLKVVKQMIRPVGAEADEAALALAMMDARQSEQLAADVQAMARKSDADANFNPTTAQLSADEYLLAVEQSTLRGNIDNSVSVSRREAENESSLEIAFDAITKQSNDAAAAYSQGQKAVATASSRTGQTKEAADELLAGRKATAAQDFAPIEAIEEQEAGRALRDAVWEARKRAKKLETDAYNRYKEAYGWDGHAASEIKIEKTARFQSFMDGINEEKIAAWFGSTKAGKGKLTPERLLGKKGDTIEIFGPDGQVLSSISTRTDTPIDIHQLEVGLKELRRWGRINARNEVATDVPGFDINRMIKEVEQLRRDTISPEMLNLAEKAEQASFDRVKAFDKSALRAIIKKDGGEYIMDDTKVFGYVLGSNDKEAAAHFMNIMRQDPGAVVAAKKSLWSLYKSEVAPDGYAKPALHNAFMKKHGNTLGEMFSPTELKRMNAMGDMGGVVERSIKRYDQLVSKIDKSFAGKIENTDPEHVASKIFSKGFSVNDTRMLMRMLDDYGSGDQVRKMAGDYVKAKTFSGGTLNLSGLEKILNNDISSPVNKLKLTAMYGHQYVNDLEKIFNAGTMIRLRPQRALIPGKTNAFTDFMRVLVAPPLTRKGRAQTLLVNVRYDAANRALAKALLDPNELRRIVSLETTAAGSKRSVRILSQLGGSYAATGFDSAQLTEDNTDKEVP